jgi:hypothetical protein
VLADSLRWKYVRPTAPCDFAHGAAELALVEDILERGTGADEQGESLLAATEWLPAETVRPI